MAKKVFKQNTNVGGFEAPRNSLELPVETSQSYYAVGDNIPYSYEVRHEWPENAYSTEAPMKKLINEEISRRPNTRRNAPSVVARLMGMDTLPFDTKSTSHKAGKNNENPAAQRQDKEQNKKGSGGRAHSKSNSLSQLEFEAFQPNDRDSTDQLVRLKSKKPKPREHPQEEELQKFKKEFEAWQAARFRECSKVAELSSIPCQLLAQETLNKEKIALYANSSRNSTSENPVEPKCSVKEKTHEGGGLKPPKYGKKLFPSQQKETYSLSRRIPCRNLDESPLVNSIQKLDNSSAPTRIVVLRPGPERISDSEDSRVSSSGTSEERGSLEDFLEEVKERLKCELEGKIKRENMVRGRGNETPYSVKPSDPKQIAQRIAKQVRESVTRDLGMNLLRSESTRSYRSEIQYNESGSPEFINRDTRRILAERLRNVLKGEIDLHAPPVGHGSSNSSLLGSEREIPEQPVCKFMPGGKLTCWDIEEEEPEMQSRSFRRISDEDGMHNRDLSPRNLVRSMSAPVSGTSFGKLLLEDRHVLTGAHIRRKHEATESVIVDLKKRKKEKSKFKEKVSRFRYSFTLKGSLFGRKVQSVDRPPRCEYEAMKDFRSGPTVVMNYGDRHENSTEVPPSPASVCSSAHEELWRATDHLSSTSVSDLSPIEDSTQIFREISSNLNELRRQLHELDAESIKEAVVEEQPSAELELDDVAEAYIRDLLVASGLYQGSSGKVLSRWDPLAKPISNQIFEELEESYVKKARDHQGSTEDQSEKLVNHKLLLDLSNEALSMVLSSPVTMSRLRKSLVCPIPRPPSGRKLLDSVWGIVCGHLYPPTDNSFLSLDGMVARDLSSTPWFGLMSDEVDALGKEIESHITGNLIEDLVKDIKS